MLRRMLILATILLAGALLVACGGGSDDPAATPAPTSSGTEAAGTATPGAQPNPTIVGTPDGTSQATPPAGGTAEATPTAAAAPDATPAATETPPASPTSTPTADGDVEGFPFGTAALRSAVEERDAALTLAGDDPLCPDHTTTASTYRALDATGDSGPVVALWVFDDSDALGADWEAVPGSSPTSLTGCELTSGYVYWNENLVLAVIGWIRDGEEGPIGSENPRAHPVVEAFLSLTR